MIKFTWVSNPLNFFMLITPEGHFTFNSDLAARVQAGKFDLRIYVPARSIVWKKKVKPGIRARLIKESIYRLPICRSDKDSLYIAAMQSDHTKHMWFKKIAVRVVGVGCTLWNYTKRN